MVTKMRIAGIVLILSVLSTFGVSRALPEAVIDNTTTLEMLRLRAIVESQLPDADMGSLDGILAVQHYVYENVRFGRDDLDWARPSWAYLSMVKGETKTLCGGYAFAYMLAIESQGIPARYVGLFSDNTNPYSSHATVEVYVAELNKWIAVDPTFGVTYTDSDGNYLDYAELWAMAQRGEPWIENNNGYRLLPQRTWSSCYFELRDVLRYVVIHPSLIWDGERVQESELVLLPECWDGRIDNIDVTATESPYISLTGILR